MCVRIVGAAFLISLYMVRSNFCRKHEKVLIVHGKIRVVLRSAVSKEVRVSGPVSRELQAVRKIIRRMLVQLT